MNDLKEMIKTLKPNGQQKIPLRSVSKVQFDHLEEEKTDQRRANFENLDVKIEVLYGTKTLTLKELSQLNAGSLIPLQEESQSLIEIQANGKTIGRGEIVMVDGHFGVRIIELF